MIGDLEGIMMEILYIILKLPSWSFLRVTKEDNEKSLLGELVQRF
jgi:hypothetical protein